MREKTLRRNGTIGHTSTRNNKYTASDTQASKD
jgi:hypothetical protein